MGHTSAAVRTDPYGGAGVASTAGMIVREDVWAVRWCSLLWSDGLCQIRGVVYDREGVGTMNEKSPW